MLSKQQINSIVKKLYPPSAFSHRERKHLQMAMREEIAEYLEEHPNTTYEDLLGYYTESNIPVTTQASSTIHITKTIVCIGLLIAILCTIIFLISNTWTPPTYYF